MGYGGGGGGGGSGGGGSGSGSSGGSGAAGASGYRRVGDDRTANLFVDNITNRDGSGGTEVDGIVEAKSTHFIPPSGTTAERGSRGRGVFGGGAYPSNINSIDYVTIATLGNARDFGDLSTTGYSKGAGASSTRALMGGSAGPAVSNTIEYITISATGNALDFGDLTRTQRFINAASNSTRAIWALSLIHI